MLGPAQQLVTPAKAGVHRAAGTIFDWARDGAGRTNPNVPPTLRIAARWVPAFAGTTKK